MTRFVSVALGLLAFCAACVPTPRFEWGNYEMALYRYHKQPAEREAYRAALAQAIERGEQHNRVAPGLNAELGYLSLEAGDASAAIALFEREIALYPESARFLGGVIEQLRNPTVQSLEHSPTSEGASNDGGEV